MAKPAKVSDKQPRGCCANLTECWRYVNPMRYYLDYIYRVHAPDLYFEGSHHTNPSSTIHRPSAPVSNPMINPELEADISRWQVLINNYKVDEDAFIEAFPLEALQHLMKIRYSPQDILKAGDSYSTRTIQLANSRKDIFTLMKKIGISYDDNSCSTHLGMELDPNEDVRSQLPADPLFSTVKALAISAEDDDATSSGQIGVATSHSRHSHRFSQKWTRRISQLLTNKLGSNSTAARISGFQASQLEQRSRELRFRPKWPDYLGDVSYAVVKKNSVGQRVPRVIKLTEYHIFNIKDGNFISKTYFYQEVRHIWLEEGTSSINVVMRDGHHLCLISDIASLIVQQIVTRIKVRLQLDRTDFSAPLGDGALTPYAATKIVDEISTENSKGAASAMYSFAYVLKENVLRNMRELGRSTNQIEEFIPARLSMIDADNLWGTEGNEGRNGSGSAAARPVSAPLEITSIGNRDSDDRNGSSTRKSFSAAITKKIPLASQQDESPEPQRKRSIAPSSRSSSQNSLRHSITGSSVSSASKDGIHLNLDPSFFGFKEGAKEFATRSRVQSLLFDPSTPEGNTRNHFLAKFKNDIQGENQMSCFQDMRSFIDGMHEYMLTTRGVELADCLRGTATNNKRTRSDTSRLSGFIADGLSLFGHTTTVTPTIDITSIDNETLTTVSFIIYTVVEESAYLPVREEIISVIPASYNTIEEEQLKNRIKLFSNRTQEQWGIKQEFVSPLNWQSAKFELSGLQNSLTPCMMLNALARTAKAIYSEYKLVVVPSHAKDSSNGEAFLGADDFLPIYIYVFSTSDVTRPVLNRDIMWNLCHPDQLQGECGYYLTAYESAIEFILNESLNESEQLTVIPPPRPSTAVDFDELSVGSSPAMRMRMRESF